MYVLWHTKFQGWFGKTGTWTTDLEQAQRYDRQDAILFCRKHKQGETYNLLPVDLVDLERI